jgi:hypothetical protein
MKLERFKFTEATDKISALPKHYSMKPYTTRGGRVSCIHIVSNKQRLLANFNSSSALSRCGYDDRESNHNRPSSTLSLYCLRFPTSSHSKVIRFCSSLQCHAEVSYNVRQLSAGMISAIST